MEVEQIRDVRNSDSVVSREQASIGQADPATEQPHPTQGSLDVEASKEVCARPIGVFADAAADLSRRGLCVIPVKLVPRDGGRFDKKPLVKGFTKFREPPGGRTLKKWARAHPEAQIGVVTGELSGIVVVDVDDRSGVDQALRIFGGTPLIVRTRRGAHLYYRWTGERCRNLRSEGLEIDVKGQGGFVVAPPSFGYFFERGSWDDLG